MLHHLCILSHLAVLALAAGVCGCEKNGDDMPAATQQSGANTEPTRRAPKKPPAFATHVRMSLPEEAGPAVWQQLYGTVVVVGDKTVVRLTSYANVETERFPSLMIRAIESCTPQQLVGRTVKADAYYRAKQDGVVWRSADEQPIEFQIVSMEHGYMRGEFVAGVLASGTKRSRTAEISGKFKAELTTSTAGPGR